MKHRKIVILIYLVVLSMQSFAQSISTQKCYQAKNPEALSISVDDTELNENATSAFVVLDSESLMTNQSKNIDSLSGSALNIHAFSSNIYYTSGGIGFDNERKIYAGDCDAGTVKATFSKDNTHLKLESEGYRGVAFILGECSNATLKFSKPLELVELSKNACKRKIKNLPILPEEEYE